MSTLVAILADTHGFLDPRIRDIAAHCDQVVHAGDVGSAEVLHALGAHGAVVTAIAGNNDTPRQWPEADRPALAALPRTAALDLPGGQLVVDHGDAFPARRRHARLRALHPDAAAVACGHSHRLIIDQEASPWLLNPGAAGRTRTCDGPSCVVLHAGSRHWAVTPHRFERLARRPG